MNDRPKWNPKYSFKSAGRKSLSSWLPNKYRVHDTMETLKEKIPPAIRYFKLNPLTKAMLVIGSSFYLSVVALSKTMINVRKI